MPARRIGDPENYPRQLQNVGRFVPRRAETIRVYALDKYVWNGEMCIAVQFENGPAFERTRGQKSIKMPPGEMKEPKTQVYPNPVWVLRGRDEVMTLVDGLLEALDCYSLMHP